MHHRRNRKPRREAKRIDTKRERRAADQAMQGGHIRLAKIDRWGYRPLPVPIIDDTVDARTAKRTAKRNKQKSRPKKERCSGNPHRRSHEFMYDEKTSTERYFGWNNKVRTHEVIRQIRICAHCPRTQYRKGITYPWSGRIHWRSWEDQGSF